MHTKLITVMIIEDEPGHAQLAAKCFSKLSGLDTRTFKTGRNALEYLEGKSLGGLRLHVIVLDLNMPGMDGYQVLERIKSNAATSFIPVIVLSSTDSEDEILRCYTMGANLYLVKQMDYTEYKKTLVFITEFIRMFRRI